MARDGGDIGNLSGDIFRFNILLYEMIYYDDI